MCGRDFYSKSLIILKI